MPSRKRRVLVTGVARWWGALLVQRLVEDPDVAEVIGIDVREPRYDLGRADYLKLHIHHSLIGKLVRAVGIDTVVHTLIRIDSFDMDPRRAHEMNVIGTLNLLAGCAGEGSPVRRFALKSSATSSRSSRMSATSRCATRTSQLWCCALPTASTRRSLSRLLDTWTSKLFRPSQATIPRCS